jgi:hypothetical protein
MDHWTQRNAVDPGQRNHLGELPVKAGRDGKGPGAGAGSYCAEGNLARGATEANRTSNQERRAGSDQLASALRPLSRAEDRPRDVGQGQGEGQGSADEGRCSGNLCSTPLRISTATATPAPSHGRRGSVRSGAACVRRSVAAALGRLGASVYYPPPPPRD